MKRFVIRITMGLFLGLIVISVAFFATQPKPPEFNEPSELSDILEASNFPNSSEDIEALNTNTDSPGRPVIQNNTIHTAWGTPIRGAHADIDIGWPSDEYYYTKTLQLLDAIPEYGMNTVHLYLEALNHSGDVRPLGIVADYCDFVVEEAGKRGLYVVIKMGEMNDLYIEEDSQFMYAFWEFYAPRYKDREHVIYEICNECPLELPPENLLRAYDIIRKHAPDTMVIFYSFSHSLDPEYDILPPLKRLDFLGGDRLNWENEAVGFHAYECTADYLGADWVYYTIDVLTGEGFPIINTEMPNHFALTNYVHVDFYRALEERGIAWLGFTPSNTIILDTRWRGRFDAQGLTWQPDFGNWPVMDALFPFGITAASENIALTTAGIVSKITVMCYLCRTVLTFGITA